MLEKEASDEKTPEHDAKTPECVSHDPRKKPKEKTPECVMLDKKRITVRKDASPVKRKERPPMQWPMQILCYYHKKFCDQSMCCNGTVHRNTIRRCKMERLQKKQSLTNQK